MAMKQWRRLMALAREKQDEGEFSDDQLDDLVHQCASQSASSINNEGMGSQIEYLLEAGATESEIEKIIRGV